MELRINLTDAIRTNPSLREVVRRSLTPDITKIIFYNIPLLTSSYLNDIVNLKTWITFKFEKSIPIVFQDDLL